MEQRSSEATGASKTPANKWFRYYGDNFLPWDSGKPSSQLVEFVEHTFLAKEGATSSGMRKPNGLRAIEIGCGTGASCVYLAQCGFHVTGVDLVQDAVDEARAQASAAGVAERCTFIVTDAFDLPWAAAGADAAQVSSEQQEPARQQGCGFMPAAVAPRSYDLVYDCQTFHVLRQIDEPRIVAIYRRLLKPGGYLLTLTGNAKEPEVGPSVLTCQELGAAFSGMDVVSVTESRFDMTPAYAKLEQPPLAWCGVFREPAPDTSHVP